MRRVVLQRAVQMLVCQFFSRVEVTCLSKAEHDAWEGVGATLLMSAELCQSKNSARERRMRHTESKQKHYTLAG